VTSARACRKTINPRSGHTAKYVSGLITTEKTFRQTYGYFEAVVSLPSVRGAFPAFWLLGEPYTPHQGDEIDIFEHLGGHPDKLWLNSHLKRIGADTPGLVRGVDMTRPRAIGLLWTANRLTWFIDGKRMFSAPNRDFHRPMYMLLNLAVGGWDGALPEDAGGFPASMRVYSVKAWALPKSALEPSRGDASPAPPQTSGQLRPPG